jgi:DNA (cytosine-5)-methyltransferase 1
VATKLNAIDLFSGCGGFSYGFQEAGFNVLLGVDNTEIALKTFKKNHKNSSTLLLDLYERSAIDEIVNQCHGITVDVIIAGPPCQGFSLTGTRKKDDKRNSLFNAVFDLAEQLSPKALVIENVPGIVNLYNGETKQSIMTRCEQLGYSCNFKELFAPDYGVPQIRKRVFFVAIKKELGKFEFPQIQIDSDHYVTCEQAIGDLPSLEKSPGSEEMDYKGMATSAYQKKMREHSATLLNHTGTNHTDHVINVISQVPEGGNYKDLPPGVGDSRKFNEAWTRYHSQKPSKTIDTGHRNHFHYKWNRVPTVRENARLQSFPDKFVFLGTKTQQYRQVGNAVPPLLGSVIALSLKKYLR